MFSSVKIFYSIIVNTGSFFSFIVSEKPLWGGDNKICFVLYKVNSGYVRALQRHNRFEAFSKQVLCILRNMIHANFLYFFRNLITDTSYLLGFWTDQRPKKIFIISKFEVKSVWIQFLLLVVNAWS